MARFRIRPLKNKGNFTTNKTGGPTQKVYQKVAKCKNATKIPRNLPVLVTFEDLEGEMVSSGEPGLISSCQGQSGVILALLSKVCTPLRLTQIGTG